MRYSSRAIYTDCVKYARWTLGSLLVLAGLLWFADYLMLTLPYPKTRVQWETVRVDQVYTILNRYNQVEWSRGNPIMEVCGNSWLPHKGRRPCWYVKTHTMHENRLY